MTKRQAKYNEIVKRCINILKSNGYKLPSDLYTQWGDDLSPAYYLLKKEITLIKSIFRNKSNSALLSLYFHLENLLDNLDIYDDDNYNYYTVAGESMLNFLTLK